jgi:hypothetical protein
MKIALSISAAVMLAGSAATVAALTLASSAVTMAAERPGFEVSGFPISPVQLQLVGAADVREQPPVAALTRDGLPASPHQVNVLGPRPTAAVASNAGEAGIVAR